MSNTYDCNICNYLTSRKADYLRHKQSKRHIKNVGIKSNLNSHDTSMQPQCTSLTHSKSNTIACTYCKLIYSRQSSLTRHLKVCEMKNLTLTNTIIKELKSQNKKIEADLQYYKNLIKDNGIGKKTYNVQYNIMTNHANAPAIEYAKPTIEELGFDSDINASKMILHHYKHKTLIELIGNAVISNNKKESPNDQSIWVADITRLNMLIKKQFKDNDSKWITDKAGIETIKYAISPYIELIKKLIKVFSDNYSKITKNASPSEMQVYQEYVENTIKLKKEIQSKRLENNILKFVAPNFTYEQLLLQ